MQLWIDLRNRIPDFIYNRRYGGHAQDFPNQWEWGLGIHGQGPCGGLHHSKNDFRRHIEGRNHSRERCRLHFGNRGFFWGHYPRQNPGYHFHHQSAHREDLGLGGKHLTINMNTMQKEYTCSELSSYLLFWLVLMTLLLASNPDRTMTLSQRR